MSAEQTEITQAEREPIRQEYIDMIDELEGYLADLVPMVRKMYEEAGRPKTCKMNNFAMPPEIQAELGTIGEKGASTDEIIKAFETTMKYSLKSLHPMFLDKLWAHTEPVGQVSEFMASIMNCMVHVYHVAPVFSVMEVECVLKFAGQFGFDTTTADGCLNPGGSMSNMMALLAARHETFPHVREEGWLPEDKPVAFCADLSHYSLKRGAMVAGMGMNQMIAVPCSRETGQMIPAEFERCVQEAVAKGQKPFFVNSLGGSTVFGAFDDFAAITEIAKKYNMWHHVDGCWGGFLIFSERCKNTIWKGIETVDSVSINPHKGLSVPGQCALLLTNNKKGALQAANNSGASYLFHKSEYSDYDLGDKTLSCGRKNDALKLWMSFKRNGVEGYTKKADNAFDKAHQITKLIKADPEKFELTIETAATNVCFWYIPPYFRNENIEKYDFDAKCKTHKMIFDKFQKLGTIMVQHNPCPEYNLPNFFRLVLKGELSRFEDMEYILAEIDRLGQDVNPSNPDWAKF